MPKTIKLYYHKTDGGREEYIKKYGLEIVENDEKIWRERGYVINYKNGLLEAIK